MQPVAESYQRAAVLPVQQQVEFDLYSGADERRCGEVECVAKAGEQYWLTIPRLNGNIGVYCNGELIATSHRFPSLYRFLMPFSVRLSGLREGANDVRIEPLGEMSAQRVSVQIRQE